jgi:hypothetical protein
MNSRTQAAIGIALWLAAAPLALAAGEDKAETKASPASGEARAAQAGDDAKDDAKGIKAAGPHLRMAGHHGRNPGGDRDLRHCLDLPTPKEVIRCSEQK